MLKREEAQAALKAFQVADWEARRLSELEQLPPLLGAWGKALLQLEGSRYEDVGKAVRAMDSWAVEVRSQLLDVAFGPISSWVAKTYDLLLELPYQQGCARRSFRSSNSRHYAARRHSWLMSMLTITRGYEQPVEWYAAWAPFLGYRADALGLMFAAAINEGGKVGDQVFEIICDSARGEHDIGSMGRHVTRALLVANRPEGWQLIENMLVAAQRQEGLRQVILETIDEAHPEAFARMLRVIVEQNMVRFSATIRAADVWFGLNWTVDQKRWVKETLEKTLDLFELDLLEKDKQIESLLQSDDPTRVYLALWRMAFDDAMVAVEAATRLLKDERAERRFVAVYLLRQMNDIPEATSVLLTCLSDSHLRVAVEAFLGMQYSGLRADESELFEQLETFIERFSEKEMTLEPLVWPWMQAKIARSQIADALTRALGFRPIERLLPYLSTMTPWVRAKQAERLIKITPWDESIRSAVFDLLGDRSSVVRESAISALKRHYIPTPAGAPQLEALLTRKAADLRRGILALLLKLSDAEAVNSAERLLAAPKAPQRLAGLELLEQLQRTERADGREIALQYQQQRKEKREKRSASEQELLDKLLANTQVVPTLDDALGLAPPAQRSPSPLPQPPQSPIPLTSPAAERLLLSLDELIEAHKTTPVTLQYVHREHTEELLGNVRWLPLYRLKKSREENIEQFPLVQVWLNWWQNRPASLRDEDGLEGIRAIAAFTQSSNSFNASFYNPFRIAAPPDWVLRYKQAWFTNKEQIQSENVSSILQWLLQVERSEATSDQGARSIIECLLNAAEYTLSQIATVTDPQPYDWREADVTGWLSLVLQDFSWHKQQWSEAQTARLWRLMRWYEQPDHPSLPRWKPTEDRYNAWTQTTAANGHVRQMRPNFELVMAAFNAGVATEADIYDFLVGCPDRGSGLSMLRSLTNRKPHPLLKKHPRLVPLVDRARDRILEIELSRGELPTAATGPALSLSCIVGIPNLIKLLQNFGTEKFARGWLRDSQSKASAFSHLFRISFPDTSETPAEFARQTKAAKITAKRLVELAVYAPQWASYVEYALKWKGLSEAVWWFHAHTKDNAWQVPQEIRELWSAQIAERTPLSSQDLIGGAVDVAWFKRVYKQLGVKRWAELNEAAKYASGGGGHKRAQLFAAAMTGAVERATLITRIEEKRHQDVVRALGLLPLPKGKQKEADLLARYEIIQAFVRTSRKFGAQRKASEKLAARIGLENLARTAGFPDPQRLEWAMERVAIADLAKGPVTVTVEETTVSLSLTDKGKPQIAVIKKGKALKSIPAKLKKNEDIKALQARKKTITQQASRIRQSLERAMCRGDEFTGTELKQLLTHPILRPVLGELLFINAEGLCGYPIDSALVSHDGSAASITAKMRLRIAHPVDLAAGEQWHLWQQQCFDRKQIQPFKQIFRELYVPTASEQQGQEGGSVRYAGQQVNPRQAVALLNQRNWVSHPEEGIRRTFHDENLLVWVEFEEGWYTPTEVEGFTLDQVCFADRLTYKRVKISQVPPRVFSEVMRDLDLVVSVAHQGGVDPEASASTVEMRAALLQETIRLLKIENVRLQEPYALIEGQLGSYTLHLGSATVHRQPGGALCIVPVHAQHRGRLFLPFADDDPKTAEVISKALLLAQDHKIQDPTILEQLR